MICIGYLGGSKLSELIFGTSEYRTFLIITFWTAAFQILQTIPFAVYRAQQESKKYSIFNLIFLFLRLFLIIYLVAWLRKGVWGVVMGNFVATLFSSIILLWTIKGSLKPEISRTEIVKLLKFGAPLIIVNLAGITIIMADRYILRHYSGLSEVGIYSLGYQFGLIISILLVQPLKLVWPPMMFSIEKQEYANQYYSRILTYFLVIGLFFFLGISLLSEDVLKLIASPDYWGAAIVIPLITFAYVLFGVQELLNLGLALNRRTEYYAYIFVVGAVLNVGLNILLIPKFGILGAAFSIFITYLVICILKYYSSQRYYSVRYEWERIIKLVLISIVIFIIGYSIKIDSIWGSVAIHAIVAISFPLVLILTRFFYEDERDIVKRVLNNRISLKRLNS